ncbi:hypothetical protein ACHHYP_00212 [Achlya hypogyna]|uniref:Leucine-rich repeat-containing protein 56 n=1 Tax=Achlya hypogyna TaxID=1202772 RepID=A0A1V9ZB88_ACHHY|nr:hypothetical protein ACHHYP_00212 [Achlya hypogyna]
MDGPTLLDCDAREEVDTVMHAASPLPAKAKFLIRPLPKACNPVPASPAKLLKFPDVMGTIEEDNPFGDLTHDKLRQLSGKQDLTKVTFLQLTVDTAKQSVEALGELLPSLLQLRLHESHLHSFRDLGTSLHSLQVLWLQSCGVTDLDGIGALTGLRELYLQHNAIADISPLSMHDELAVVDLEGNAVLDIVQIEQLGLCPQLSALKLQGNPVAAIPQYRSIVASYIPHLASLDDKPVTAADRTPVTAAMIDLALSFDHTAGGIKAVPESPSRPGSVGKSSFEMLLDAAKDHHSSNLTHGTDVVFAGNVTSALRRRSHEHYVALGDEPARPPTPASNFPPRPSTPLQRESITATLDRACELDLSSRLSSKSRDSILHELKAWKLENAVAQVGRPETPGKKAKAKPRPHTSGGRAQVREAFGEVPAPRRHSRSSPTRAAKPPTVEILVLDDGTPDDSPPTYAGLHGEWTLELQALSPRIQPAAIPSFKKQLFDDDDGHSSSDDDDDPPRRAARSRALFNVGESLDAIDEWTNRLTHAEDGPVVVVPEQERCKTPKRRTSAGPQPLDLAGAKATPPPDVCSPVPASPAKATPVPTPATGLSVTKTTAVASPATVTSPVKAAAVATSVVTAAAPVETATTHHAFDDDRLVTILQGKDKAHAHHLKTKESFRAFFAQIGAARLESLLRRAYGDGDKTAKRLQLMQGRTTPP